jgi:hypothetical protein
MKVNRFILIGLGCIGLMAFLYVSNALDQKMFIGLGLIAVLSFLSGAENVEIDLEAAERVAKDWMIKMMDDKRVEGTELMMLPEAITKNMLLKTKTPQMIKSGYDIMFSVEGTTRRYYKVSVSILGKVTGYTEVKWLQPIAKLSKELVVIEGELGPVTKVKENENTKVS